MTEKEVFSDYIAFPNDDELGATFENIKAIIIGNMYGTADHALETLRTKPLVALHVLNSNVR